MPLLVAINNYQKVHADMEMTEQASILTCIATATKTASLCTPGRGGGGEFKGLCFLILAPIFVQTKHILSHLCLCYE
jgi:hypothetical protein